MRYSNLEGGLYPSLKLYLKGIAQVAQTSSGPAPTRSPGPFRLTSQFEVSST